MLFFAFGEPPLPREIILNFSNLKLRFEFVGNGLKPFPAQILFHWVNPP